MKSKVYFISDLHLGHKNILKYSPTTRGHFRDIGDHNRRIIDTINKNVRQQDVLWILGDVAFGKENLKYIRMINCNKINLVLGNHDVYSIEDYLNAGFNKVFGMVDYKEFVLSHMPVHTQQLDTRYKYNIHGHLHNEVIEDTRYFNVNIDVMDIRVISLEEVRSAINNRETAKTVYDNYANISSDAS